MKTNTIQLKWYKFKFEIKTHKFCIGIKFQCNSCMPSELFNMHLLGRVSMKKKRRRELKHWNPAVKPV